MKGSVYRILTGLLLALLLPLLLVSCSVGSQTPIAQLGQPITAEHTVLDNGKAVFRGFVQLGNEVADSAAILELELTADVKEDPATGQCRLESAALSVKPIGCDTLELSQELVSPDKYMINCHIGTNPFSSYRQQMPIQCAKILALSSNIAVTEVASNSDNLNISTVNQLQNTGSDGSVLLEYKILEQYFDCWYAIEFILTGRDQGAFTVY